MATLYCFWSLGSSADAPDFLGVDEAAIAFERGTRHCHSLDRDFTQIIEIKLSSTQIAIFPDHFSGKDISDSDLIGSDVEIATIDSGQDRVHEDALSPDAIDEVYRQETAVSQLNIVPK